MMKTNVGGVDRALRVLIGLGLIAWAGLFQGPVWAYVGVLPLLSGLLRWCPAYSFLGVCTCRSSDK